MQCQATMNCYTACAEIERSAARSRTHHRLATRLAVYTAWVLALLMMIYGARFVLQQSPSSSEFAAATYVFDDGTPARIAPTTIDTRGAAIRGVHR